MHKPEASIAQLVNCILLHAYSHAAMQLPVARAQTKLHSLFNELT